MWHTSVWLGRMRDHTHLCSLGGAHHANEGISKASCVLPLTS